MDRREAAKRHGRRLQIRFWVPGDDSSPHRAYTTNVSRSGLFIAASSPPPRGTRIRVEVLHERGFVAEAVVVHSARVPPALQSVRSSGMGVRFLQIEELVRPLLPQAPAKRQTPEQEKAPAEDVAAESEPPAVEPEAPEPEPAPAETAAEDDAYPRPEPAPDAIADGLDRHRFTVRFGDVETLLRTVRREIDFGGVFVATDDPAEVRSVVTVDLRLPPPLEGTLSCEATVVRLIEPQEAGGETGMGVAFAEPQALLERLRTLLAPYEER